MKRRTLLAGGVVALGGVGGVYALDDGGSGADGSDSNSDGLDRAAAETAIREGVNELRFSQSVPALGGDTLLQTVARDHSADMAARDFFGHVNPDGEDATDRAGCRAGETLYRGDLGTVESAETGETYDASTTDGLTALVVESWGASRSHFDVLTDNSFQNAGVGIHVTDDGFFVTAVMC